MLKLEHTEVVGWEAAIRGMRNPMNSWEKSDSGWCPNGTEYGYCYADHRKYCPRRTTDAPAFCIGPNDLDLMKRLWNAGTDHRKFMRMIAVYVDITAPLYWWKEFDTYKVGTVANSCSTMHKITEKEFAMEDFSHEHLIVAGLNSLKRTIDDLNSAREGYLDERIKQNPEWRKEVWWQMIQLLPSSYNQRRTVMLNYEVLANIYKSRKDHRLDEWCEHKNIDIETLKRYYAGDYKLRDEKSLANIGFCDWIKTLPYSELITRPSIADIPICNEIMEEAKRRAREEVISQEDVSESSHPFLKKSLTIPKE